MFRQKTYRIGDVRFVGKAHYKGRHSATKQPTFFRYVIRQEGQRNQGSEWASDWVPIARQEEAVEAAERKLEACDSPIRLELPFGEGGAP